MHNDAALPVHRRLFRRQGKNLDIIPTTPTTPTTTTTGASSTQPTPSLTSSSTTPVSGTATQATSSTTSTDGGLLGGLLGPPTTTATSSSTSLGSTSSSTPTTSSVSSILLVSSVSSTTLSTAPPTYSVTTTGNTPPPPTQDTTNTDSGPIAGGVIGGLFAVAALGMFISFLLRRRRQKRIDKAIFDTTDFHRSAVVLDDAGSDILSQKPHTPRPPTMIERRVVGPPGTGQQRTFGSADPGMFSAPQGYGGGYGAPGQPHYPPQPVQRSYYYPQQVPDRPYSPHLQPGGGYNQVYDAPSRVQTPLHELPVDGEGTEAVLR